MTGRLLPAGYLHTAGSSIADVDGNPVQLAGVNWYGADCNANCVGGLHLRNRADICALVVTLGFNVVRLPFTVESVLDDSSVSDVWLTANRDLVPTIGDATYLGVMDAVIAAAQQAGLKVILDCHRSYPGWSTQENGLWYAMNPAGRILSTQDWIDAWTTLVRRYGTSATVIGCDLRNELSDNQSVVNSAMQYWPHTAGSRWGGGVYSRGDTSGASNDWRQAATDCGNAILAQNPNLLIFVEGIRTDPAGPASNGNRYWPGGNLTGILARGEPITLSVPNRLVYSVHDYGPDMDRSVPWCQLGTTASDSSACIRVWDATWGYIAQQEIAPLWIGEFGTRNGRRLHDTTPPQNYTEPNALNPQGAWFTHLVEYIGSNNLHWCYWALNGTQSAAPRRNPLLPEDYGVLNPEWSDAASPPLLDKLQSIQ
ncbi:MAG: hypothetical protein PVSMB7_16110 [Chloroflexota bacterium]